MEYAIFLGDPPVIDDDEPITSDTFDYAEEECVGESFEAALEGSETLESIRREMLDACCGVDGYADDDLRVVRQAWVVAKADGSVQRFSIVIELSIEPFGGF